jgi:uncharacterized protein YodC (DUF2158 family)
MKPGDTVQLKSGGPKMTVTEVKPINGVTRAWCSWFINDKLETASFPVDSLNKV